ncbi:hypothetical protein IJ117_00800 [Candidatus Saccharibacteria bacterium]|nr:hypothetical protein [Candidatus Saccharibacteria bacterium]
METEKQSGSIDGGAAWQEMLSDLYEEERMGREDFAQNREMLAAKLESLPKAAQDEMWRAQNAAFMTAFERSGLPQAEELLGRLFPEGPDGQDGEYDYMRRLLEKNDDGYVVGEMLEREVFDFYKKAALKLQEDFRADMAEELKSRRYVKAVETLVEKGLLPEVFLKNVNKLDPAAAEFLPPKYYLYDSSYKTSAGGHARSGGEVRFNIGLYRPNHASNVVDAVMDHEHTHYIAGRRITFGDEEKNRRMNEAMTESIAYLITVASGREPEVSLDDVKFGDGHSYRAEREEMKEIMKTDAARDFYLTAYALE